MPRKISLSQIQGAILINDDQIRVWEQGDLKLTKNHVDGLYARRHELEDLLLETCPHKKSEYRDDSWQDEYDSWHKAWKQVCLCCGHTAYQVKPVLNIFGQKASCKENENPKWPEGK